MRFSEKVIVPSGHATTRARDALPGVLLLVRGIVASESAAALFACQQVKRRGGRFVRPGEGLFVSAAMAFHDGKREGLLALVATHPIQLVRVQDFKRIGVLSLAMRT